MYLSELWFSPDTCPGLELLNHKCFPGGSMGKESACNAGDAGKCEFYTPIGKIIWRRARQPTPVFLPGESHGQRSLVGYSLWVEKSQTWLKLLSTKESDTTEATEQEPKHIVVIVLVYEGTSILLPIVVVSIYIPTNSDGGMAPFSPYPLAFIVCRLFYDGHSEWCEVITSLVLICISQQCWASFHMLSGYLCLLWRNVCSDLPIFWFGCFFVGVIIKKVLWLF